MLNISVYVSCVYVPGEHFGLLNYEHVADDRIHSQPTTTQRTQHYEYDFSGPLDLVAILDGTASIGRHLFNASVKVCCDSQGNR